MLTCFVELWELYKKNRTNFGALTKFSAISYVSLVVATCSATATARQE